MQPRWFSSTLVRAATVLVTGVAATLVVASPAAARPDCDQPDPPPVCLPRERPAPRPAASPIGHLDAVQPATTGVRVAGWAIDPDVPGPALIRLTLDGRVVAEHRAETDRPDVGAAHPAAGSRHGFDLMIAPPAHGRRTLCVNAVDGGQPAIEVPIGCHTWLQISGQPAPSEQVSLLVVNLEGRESGRTPWRERWGRPATWMAASGNVPDLLVLQEVTGSKCWLFGDCDPYPYGGVLAMIRGIRDATGITYRIAHLSTGSSVNGANPLFQGRAILYNPDRLRNATPRAPGGYRAFDVSLTDEPRMQESLPCRDADPADSANCTLLDSGIGLHWAMRSVSFARFELRAHPGMPVDVYNVHAWNHNDPTTTFVPLTQGFIPLMEQRYPATDRLFPPIVAGDFNVGPDDLFANTGPSGALEPFEVVSTPSAEDADVMGVLLGEPHVYPARFTATVGAADVLPNGQRQDPTGCRPAEIAWGDHCALHVRLVPS